MSFSALIAQYSLTGILGLDSLPIEEQSAFNLQAARLAFKNALVSCQQKGLLSEEQMNELTSVQDSSEVQNKILQIIPNFNDLTVDEVTKIKVQAFKTQINDFAKFADTKINNPETKQKVQDICVRLTILIETNTVNEEDQKVLDQYQMLRTKLNFAN